MKTKQEVRKILQSVALHGYDLISAESDIIEAMQAYHEAKLKEELMLFLNWMNEVQMDALGGADEILVDEYLKHRTNE